MSGCAIWDAPCHAKHAAGGVAGAFDDARHGVAAVVEVPITAGKVAYRGTKVMAEIAAGGYHAFGQLGRFGPLLVIAGLLWLLMKLLGVGRDAAVAVADGYTGGGASRARNVREAATNHARSKGRQLRVARERARGPRVTGGHTGTEVAVIARSDRADGRPARVTVCAPGPGEALDAIRSRFGGIVWQPSTVRPCTASPHGSHRDFTFTTHAPRSAPKRRRRK